MYQDCRTETKKYWSRKRALKQFFLADAHNSEMMLRTLVKNSIYLLVRMYIKKFPSSPEDDWQVSVEAIRFFQ